jgi:hypothetical protein
MLAHLQTFPNFGASGIRIVVRATFPCQMTKSPAEGREKQPDGKLAKICDEKPPSADPVRGRLG